MNNHCNLPNKADKKKQIQQAAVKQGNTTFSV